MSVRTPVPPEREPSDSDGFTLIELLVVMVIIGILAAIAIPSFLAQRDKGYQSAEKSDLKTVSIAEQAYATDNNGSFVSDAGVTSASTSADVLVAQGAKVSGNDTVKAALYTTSTANDTYCLTATSGRTAAVWYLSSVDDTPVKVKPNAACL